ncbi:hypothetical protein [Aquimarina rubra]|uniref:Uncharacterized protein n=1 Tax=Aquimarina rubra TaxID=1920033 RepID=A0ABW5L8B3_9FLAO
MKINIMINKLGFLICILTIFGCSEGDILDLSVEFDPEPELQNCANENDNTFVFYTIDSSMKKSLSVNFTSTTFDIAPEAEDVPVNQITEITLNASTNQLIYREYGSTIVGEDYFCNSVPPANVSVTEELISTNGTLEIMYEALTTNSETQESFNRKLTLRNITLEGNGKAIRREFLDLGTEVIDIDISIDFDAELLNCSDTNGTSFVFYKLDQDSNSSLSFNFVDAAFDITPAIDDISVDTPTVINLNPTNNQIIFRAYDTAVTDSDAVEYFCNNTPPIGVNITKELISSSGTVEVSYEESDPVENPRKFTRTLTLKDNVFEAANGNPIQIESLVIGSDEIIVN